MPKIYYVLLITLLLLPFPGNGMAAAPGKVPQQHNSFSLTPSLGTFVYNPSGGTEVAPLVGVKASYEIIGASIVDSIGMEGTFNYFSTLGGKSTRGAMLRGDVTYLITPKSDIVPLIAVGLGDLLVNGGGPKSSLLLNYGAGLKYFFEDWLAWRFDVRHILVYRNVDTRNNFELTAGLTYVFGKEHKKRQKLRTAPVLSVPVPAIPSIGDTEPGAPAGTGTFNYSIMEKLEIIGPSIYGIGTTPPPFREAVPPTPPTPRPKAYQPLPGQAPPEEAPEPLDVQPPAPEETPEPAVQPEGRALPESYAPAKAALPPAGTASATRLESGRVTPTPAAASRNGSAQQRSNPTATPRPDALISAKAVIPRIYFNFDSYALSAEARRTLVSIADYLNKDVTARVRIEGHCDNLGSDDYNVALGERRANAALKYLLKLGVPPQRLSAISYGKEKPADAGHDESAEARNRRDEFIVISNSPRDRALIDRPAREKRKQG